VTNTPTLTQSIGQAENALRAIQRITHLVGAAVLILYLYTPLGNTTF
jgi:hypothetical protein